MAVDGTNEVEKVNTEVGEVFKVLRDHHQRALENSIENTRDFIGDRAFALVDDLSVQRQHFGFTRVGNVSPTNTLELCVIGFICRVLLVVAEDGSEQGRQEVADNRLDLFGLVNPSLDQAQSLALDTTKTLDLLSSGRLRTLSSDDA